MRLLKLQDDGELSLVEFASNTIPRYAILSHTWGTDDEEVTFKDLVEGTGKTKAGYRKIRFCTKQAASDGLQFSWVDTCCIDKSSSAELSEAINSMFHWFHNAVKCYVYLSDVSIGDSVGNGLSSQQTWKPAFQHSRWFTRGWTLQELIAPTFVDFYSEEGKRLGNKNSLVREIHEITGITVRALQGSPLSGFSVDERMSWAAGRETKREEDGAYSLLGIFDIHMPLLYGEGRGRAFIRLQKEIKESLKDESHILPRGTKIENNSQNRASASNSGPVFNGSISSRYVIPSTHVAGGTVNFNFSENATAKRRCDEDCSTGHFKRARVTHRPHRDRGPRQYCRGDSYKPDNNDEDESDCTDDERSSEDNDKGGSEDSDEGSSEDSEEGSSEDSEESSSEDSEEVDPESESDGRWH